jgi:alkyl sulfatase BDS1-like metallo-beta-lactamase superfamily hydrolase
MHPALQALFDLLEDRTGGSGQMSDRMARVAHATTARGLEELLRSPVRRLLLDGLFRELGHRINGNQLSAHPASVRCSVTGQSEAPPDVYELHFHDGNCRVIRGPTARRPELRVQLDDRELIRLATGQSTPMQALFSGRIKVGGDAAGLASLFLNIRK